MRDEKAASIKAIRVSIAWNDDIRLTFAQVRHLSQNRRRDANDNRAHESAYAPSSRSLPNCTLSCTPAQDPSRGDMRDWYLSSGCRRISSACASDVGASGAMPAAWCVGISVYASESSNIAFREEVGLICAQSIQLSTSLQCHMGVRGFSHRE